jgi:hypothetical protein
LQFRVHKDGEDDYIVRSNGNYYMRRSVSTELNLEAGCYTVLLKIIATRVRLFTPEDVIRGRCRGRREKVLAIGLSYDLAHAKGQFREIEKQQKKQAKVEVKRSIKATLKKVHELRRKERKMMKMRQKRKERKLLEKKQLRRAARAGEITPAEELDNGSDGLGISVNGEDVMDKHAAEDEMRPTALPHHVKSASTGSIRVRGSHDRSDSPGPGGFGGRG